MARRTLRLLTKVVGGLLVLALVVLWGLLPIWAIGSDPSFWEELYIMFHLAFAFFILIGAWQGITASGDNDGDSGAR